MIRTNVWITQQQIRNTHTYNQFWFFQRERSPPKRSPPSLIFVAAVAHLFSCHPSPKAEDLLFAFAFAVAVGSGIGQGFSLGILTRHKSGLKAPGICSLIAS